jgi:hypothetical protein
VDEAIQQTLEGLCLRRANSTESRSVLLQGIDPIQNQHMQVDVQVQGGAEPLDQGNNSRSSAAAGRESCPVGQISLDGANDDREAAAERVRSTGEQQAEWPGEAQDPLANGYFRKDMVDEVSRGLDHPPSAARRAEAPSLAGKRDQVFVAAAIALHAHETVLEPPAAQVILELAKHKAWQRVLVPLEIIPQGRQMLFDDGIERRVLWLMALVPVAGAKVAIGGNGFHRAMMAGWSSCFRGQLPGDA